MTPNGNLPRARIHERRSFRRYPVQVQLLYRIALEGGAAATGAGETVNVSSSGFLFRSSRTLPLGTLIEAVLEWPGRRRRPRLALYIAGSTVRREGDCTAVSIRDGSFGEIQRGEAVTRQ